MRFQIEDKTYEYDGKILVEDAMFIFDKSGVGVTGLNQALLEVGNPYAIAAWCFLLKRRAGEAVRYDDMLKLDIANYHALPDAPSPEQAAKKDASEGNETPDPPSVNGTTRRRATTRTS